MKDRSYSIQKDFKIKAFLGLDNRSDPASLAELSGEQGTTLLSTATDIDITRDGKIRRRKGWSLESSGDYHSLWQNSSVTFVVKNQVLGTLDSSLSFTPLVAASERPFVYADTGPEVYLSDNQSVYRWDGELTRLDQEGRYDFARSDLDLADDATRYNSPPPGHVYTWMFGRLWVGTATAIFYSRAYRPGQFDLTKDFLEIPEATLIQPTEDGYYLGTQTDVLYVSGGDPKKPSQTITASPYPAILGTAAIVERNLFDPSVKTGKAVIWDSLGGKMLGLPGGNVEALTFKRHALGDISGGAAFLRESNGNTHHVSALKNRNSDSSNMRASDVATAEIVRNGILI